MTQFDFRALDASGKTQSGMLEAAAQAQVVEALQAKGWVPMDIAPVGSGLVRNGTWNWRRGRTRVRLAELVAATDQLSTLLSAGQPLDRALGILNEVGGNPALMAAIADVRDQVRGGAALSDALARHAQIFSSMYCAMVRAGEAGGVLPQVLARLAEHLARASEFRRNVTNALVYPVILLVTVLLSMGFLLAYVVPQFADMYANLHAELPWFSRIVLGIGMAVRRWWMLLAGAVFVALLVINLWLKRPESKRWLEQRMLSVRGLGPLLAKMEAERYLRTLATLLVSGVHLVQGLRISRAVFSNGMFVDAAARAEDRVRGGTRFSDAWADAAHFPRLPLQMARIGEEAGELDAMLLKASDTLAADIRTRLDRVLAALVPAVTVLMFLLIGAVVMSILVPLYDLTSVIG
ncbi:type II secretion system F family protein [Solilutibacter silvestris]|uniref:Type II secretory pathway component PulF n=1 Tax=Solilutibacter silvestris TaxID=1645665 RepID=A0A2K1Q470_9GAMM|nr:type II secretion system F family protein [Lysobacter silvestris]PNS09835.1 Type II secretory pathway component PulF [Lysobacter silvestris]